MSATAAAKQPENAGDGGTVSDGECYVTLLLAEIDAHKRTLGYVNSHHPALLFRAKTGTVTRMNSSCPPIGISTEEICELARQTLLPATCWFPHGWVTEAENRLGEECGTERPCSVVRQGSSLPAEELMSDIFRTAADFCQVVGFRDDVTILVVKCNFDGSQQLNS